MSCRLINKDWILLETGRKRTKNSNANPHLGKNNCAITQSPLRSLPLHLSLSRGMKGEPRDFYSRHIDPNTPFQRDTGMLQKREGRAQNMALFFGKVKVVLRRVPVELLMMVRNLSRMEIPENTIINYKGEF